MKLKIHSNVTQVVILDVSSLYAKIYDQGYFNKDDIAAIKNQYSDIQHWRVIILNE